MFFYFIFLSNILKAELCTMPLNKKYIISTPLIIENPVRSPIVPPIADNMSTNLAALSLVILSNVEASK